MTNPFENLKDENIDNPELLDDFFFDEPPFFVEDDNPETEKEETLEPEAIQEEEALEAQPETVQEEVYEMQPEVIQEEVYEAQPEAILEPVIEKEPEIEEVTMQAVQPEKPGIESDTDTEEEDPLAKKIRKLSGEKKVNSKTCSETIDVPIPIGRKSYKGLLLAFAAVAACLVFCVGFLFYNEYMTYASVYMSINPTVKIDVNKKDTVIGLEGINEDGVLLVQNYSFEKKNIKVVVDELMQLAMDKGYLFEGGTIKLTLESSHMEWIQEHRDSLNVQVSSFLSNLSDDMNITIEMEELEINPNTTVNGTDENDANSDSQNQSNNQSNNNRPGEDDRNNTTNREENPSTNSTENSNSPDHNTTNDNTENDNTANDSTEDTTIPDNDNTSDEDVENTTSDDDTEDTETTEDETTREDNTTSESTEDEGTDDDNSGDNTSAGDTSDDDSSSEGNDDSENVENSGTLDPIISKDL